MYNDLKMRGYIKDEQYVEYFKNEIELKLWQNTLGHFTLDDFVSVG